jgi:DNA-binding transcriptional ArsR family regulator
MSEDELRRIVSMFKVLADESRLKILGVLAAGPRTGGELAELVGLRASTISHHLTRLKESGLVTVTKDGTSRVYTLDREVLAELGTEAMVPEHIASVVPEAAPDRYTERVLSAFLDQGHLTKIPSSRKKRDVVLNWLVQRFEIGVDVSEATVNERIQQVHWDSATLRRELVGGKWMVRTNGIYRRVR